uniref:Uncharacterized protein LOC112816309 isoform X1 n=1 Tax=Callorhinus ursinus TaxID=34884 RepID=A0A3Q7NDD7_CALUR|nr:uncharacterized protein LOC112816309 isoform X1 [Callorhinus ursinus]
MAEVGPGASLFPNGVPWLYALFAMLFVFFLFVMFSPFLLEIDQHIKKFLLRCKYSLHGAVRKDKEDEIKMDHLGRPGCPLESPRREVLGRKEDGLGRDPSLLVRVAREPRGSEVEICALGPSV